MSCVEPIEMTWLTYINEFEQQCGTLGEYLVRSDYNVIWRFQLRYGVWGQVKLHPRHAQMLLYIDTLQDYVM